MKTFYITTPIYYVNDKPHIGHAYTTIAADVLSRWKRLKGEEVFFLTGTDEHGSKIAQAAEKRKIDPQAFVDELSGHFKDLWKYLNITNNDFIRTSDKKHVSVVQNVFKKLLDQGDIYKSFYEGWYCVACESFWLDKEIVEQKCPDCGRAVEKLKEESYFFKLSKYEKPLLDYFEKNPLFLSPSKRSKEIINFVKSGLKDLSVSRIKEKWGVPLPFDESHTVYVWFDALLNYLTAVGYRGDEPSQKSVNNLWPADIHFVGKEIFRFHAVIWPAILMALGLELPKKVFAHGWWTFDGQKMSKSIGNIIDPIAMSQEYSVDSLRYFLLREIPFGIDGDFSKSSFLARYNAELANNLGNLFSRTLTLIDKNFNGVLNVQPKGVLLKEPKKLVKKMSQSYENAAFNEVLECLFEIVSETNKYIDQNAPWKLVKTDLKEAEKVLAECLLVLRWLSVGYAPFMPETSLQMRQQIGEETELSKDGWNTLINPTQGFVTGKKLSQRTILFMRKKV